MKFSEVRRDAGVGVFQAFESRKPRKRPMMTWTSNATPPANHGQALRVVIGGDRLEMSVLLRYLRV